MKHEQTVRRETEREKQKLSRWLRAPAAATAVKSERVAVPMEQYEQK